MCRNIKVLRAGSSIASDEEVRAAAIQFVRKISGYRVPSRANEHAFHTAVDEITRSSANLLSSLRVREPAWQGETARVDQVS